MLTSMTGFGHGEGELDNQRMTIDLRAINHRYFDVNVRAPKEFIFLENQIKKIIKASVYRGKIDVFIHYQNDTEGRRCLKYDVDLASQYSAALKEISAKLLVENTTTVYELANFQEVFVLEKKDSDEEQIKQLLEPVLADALAELIVSRRAEGERLQQDMKNKLERLMVVIRQLEADVPAVVAGYREKLTKRLEEWQALELVDDKRLEMEVAMLADKSCVDEEIVRLKSHCRQFLETMEQTGSVGKKLDFLAQELNREANTILSKAGHVTMVNQGIELKDLIEKIREQIQNIE